MKYLLSLLILFMFSLPASAGQNTYKVLRVLDGDTVYIDFNNDGFIQKDERVRLNGIDTFEVKISPRLEGQMKAYGFNQNEALTLAYLAKEFAKAKLLNKDVKAVYSAKTKRCSIGRHLMSIYYKDENGNYKNFEEEILKSGLAVIYKYSNLANELNKYENLNKMREIAKMSNNYNLVILDTFNGEYYEPDCQYIQGHGSTELIDLKSGAYGYKRAKCPQ